MNNMNFNHNLSAMATTQYSQLKSQVAALVFELKPLVAKTIELVRVGFTRNASNTPYIVYKVNNKRCCTFIKRKFFTDLVAKLLKLKYGVQEPLRSIRANDFGGLNVKTTLSEIYIPRIYINKFLERYNQIALLNITPVAACSCRDIYGMCMHAIASYVVPFNNNQAAKTQAGNFGVVGTDWIKPRLDSNPHP